MKRSFAFFRFVLNTKYQNCEIQQFALESLKTVAAVGNGQKYVYFISSFLSFRFKVSCFNGDVRACAGEDCSGVMMGLRGEFLQTDVPLHATYSIRSKV